MTSQHNIFQPIIWLLVLFWGKHHSQQFECLKRSMIGYITVSLKYDIKMDNIIFPVVIIPTQDTNLPLTVNRASRHLVWNYPPILDGVETDQLLHLANLHLYLDPTVKLLHWKQSEMPFFEPECLFDKKTRNPTAGLVITKRSIKPRIASPKDVTGSVPFNIA